MVTGGLENVEEKYKLFKLYSKKTLPNLQGAFVCTKQAYHIVDYLRARFE